MQEVCSTIDPQMGAQIKTEPPLNQLQIVTLPHQQNHLVNQKMPPNCDSVKGRGGGIIGGGVIGNNVGIINDTQYWMQSESGYINSQPSMAEFLTHLGPESPKMGPQGYPMGPTDSMDGSVPEYPWMKEKKTARKNNSQGMLDICHSKVKQKKNKNHL
jgi:homeobox protein HoxA/B2